MTEIAPLVGLQKQFQVARLLTLKELRADVRQQWLQLMHQRLPQLLQGCPDPHLPQRLTPALEELIDQIIAEDATHSYSPKRNSRSLFTTCLCHYLENRSNEQ